ncbi:MAG: cell division protein ZapE [Steroidobacteraceae bacterium]
MDAPAAVDDVRARYARAIAERGFVADPAQLAVVARLDDLRGRLIAAHDGMGRRWRRSRPRAPERGIYLWGNVGRGKTWLMDLFLTSLPFPQARRRHFHRFMHDAHALLRELGHESDPLDRAAQSMARETRVLCFDELAVADIADAMILGGLLAGLTSRGVSLVATSNVPPQQLYAGGLQRQRFLPAIELIERHTEVLEVEGKTDYRLRRLTHAGTYLDSAAPQTPARLRALFEMLAGGGSDGSDGSDGAEAHDPLEIAGRRIAVIARSPVAVWLDFAALCGGPRSQEDYIEIAREFASVIVSGVPVLDALHEDEARRFIALVDELYDCGVNLILSAAASPGALYHGERLRLEFRRTASRLAEMQSAEYLAREHRP